MARRQLGAVARPLAGRELAQRALEPAGLAQVPLDGLVDGGVQEEGEQHRARAR